MMSKSPYNIFTNIDFYFQKEFVLLFVSLMASNSLIKIFPNHLSLLNIIYLMPLLCMLSYMLQNLSMHCVIARTKGILFCSFTNIIHILPIIDFAIKVCLPTLIIQLKPCLLWLWWCFTWTKTNREKCNDR